MTHTRPAEAPRRSVTDALLALPRPIPRSRCGNCGNQLAWRRGVGRVVISHATGEDRCHPVSPTATLTAADVANAQAELDAMDQILRDAGYGTTDPHRQD